MTSTPFADLGPGAVLGSYRLVKEIGRGGFGTVWEAVHSVLPRRVAIKVMHPELVRYPGMASRMVQEATFLDDVRHPGITRVYESNLLPDRRVWLAMELVEGESLAQRLAHKRVLPAHEVACLLADISEVLVPVHRRGIVHRDLKPDNVLLTRLDKDFPLRVIDWGIARLGTIGRLTLEGMTPGTPIYMAPEQADGREIGPACDVYSLGITAYEALCGSPPFDGCTLAEVICQHLMKTAPALQTRCRAPAELCSLVHRMLDKDPSMRPTALEIRSLARSIAKSLVPPDSPSYESYELTSDNRMTAEMSPLAHEDLDVDVGFDDLEFGTTEMVPIARPRDAELSPMRKPRWTPEIATYTPGDSQPSNHVPGEVAARRR